MIACSRSTFYILASLIKYYHIGIEKPEASISDRTAQPNINKYRCPDSVYEVISWANMMTHGVNDDLEPATNLSKDWNDGKRLFALVKSFQLFTDHDIAPSPQCDAVSLTQMAMGAAADYLEIPIAQDFFDAEKDLCVPNPLQEIVWMYLALFFGKKGSLAEKFVLNWVNQIIPNADVSGFSADLWNNGKYLFLLVDNLSHGKLSADTMPTLGSDPNSLARSAYLRVMVESFIQKYLDEKLKKEVLFPMYLLKSSSRTIKYDSFTYMLYILAIKLNFEKADPSLIDLGKKRKPEEYFIESLKKRTGVAQEKTVEVPNESEIEDLKMQLESSNALTTKQQEKIEQLNNENHKLEEKTANQEQNLSEKDMKIKDFKKQLESSNTLATTQQKKIEQMNEEKHELEEKLDNQDQNLNVSNMYEVMHALAGLEQQAKMLGEELLIPAELLDDITSCNTSPTRAMYNVLRYWIVNKRGTRNTLVKAINDMEMGDKIKRKCIEKLDVIGRSHNYIIVLDASMVTKVEDVNKYDIFSQIDWRVLGMLLRLDDDTLEDIETSCTTDGDRQCTMVQQWIDTNQSYWSILVQALENPVLSRKRLADEVAKENQSLDALKARDDNSKTNVKCHYLINDFEKENKKKEIMKYLGDHPPNGQSKLKGVVFICGMTEVEGAEQDIMNVHNVFTSLDYTTKREYNPTGDELALFVKAASEIDFQDLSGGNCEHIVFHFSGHGGIDDQKRAYFVGKEKSKIPIQETILSFFEDMPAGNQKFIFFFDCCLSGDGSLTHDDFKSFHISAPLRCVVAFATAVGTKAWGDGVNGGKWTKHLCKNIDEDPTMELGEILEKAHIDVVEETKKYGVKIQAPHFESCVGPIHFKALTQYDINAPVLKNYHEKLLECLRKLSEFHLAELIVKLRERNMISKKSFDIDEISLFGRIRVVRKLLRDIKKSGSQNLEDICHVMQEANSSELSEVAEQIIKDWKSKVDVDN